MSETLPNPHGSQAKHSKTNLLSYMKLRGVYDLVVHEKISEWVEIQKLPTQISLSQVTTCRIASALLLQRLVRAFEQRLNSSVDDPKKTKGSTASSNGTKSTISAVRGTSAKNGSASKKPNPSRPKQKTPTDLGLLMQRKVKVTRLVQQAVQFVGSDVLKVLQVLARSPTVADVANTCLQILKDVNRIKEFYKIFSIASGKDPDAIDQASSIFFGVFALQALQSLRAQAISAYEFAHDFEMIYRACYQDQNFQACVHLLNPAMPPSPAPATFAADTEARNICWKIARLLALSEDHKYKSDPESKDHRRNHILLSATSIILAANMGKSIENSDLSVVGSSPGKQGSIPITEDFVCMVASPVSSLLNFLTKNTTHNQGITPITTIDIRSHFQNTCANINKLPIMKNATSSVIPSGSHAHSILAKAFTPPKEYFLLHNYRIVMQAIVMETKKCIKINNAPNNQFVAGVNERTGIVNVLLLFPMVIGEPWGIHRDAPMITSRMLCSGENSKPSDPLKDSVAVVVKLKPRPKEIKRKLNSAVPDSVRIDNKKAKTLPLPETPKQPSKKPPVEAIDLVEDDSPTPAPRAPIDVRMEEIEAPVINDATELNEWTLSIWSLSVVKPSDMLLSYLGQNDKIHGNGPSCLQNVIVPIINRGTLRIQNALRSVINVSSEPISTVLTLGRRDGQVYVNGQVDQSIQLCASVVGFYYYSLEAIIYDQMERLEFLGSFSAVLESESFHRALLACCYTCVLKGVGTTQQFPINRNHNNATAKVVMDTTESDSFTFLKVIEALCRALVVTGESTPRQLGYPIVAGLPAIIQRHIRKLQIQLIDSVLWNSSPTTETSSESSFALTIKTIKSLKGAWPPDVLEPLLPEEIVNMDSNSAKGTSVRCKPPLGSSSEANFLSFVLRKLLNSAFSRIMAVCAALDLSNETTVHTQILVAFRYLLRHDISIFNDRHVDQLLLCSIYGVCRVMKIRPEVTFGKIIDAYFTVRGKEQGERACRVIVRHVKLTSPGKVDRPGSQVVGNLVVFYNQVYVPKMQKYFIGSKSLKESTVAYQKEWKKKEELRKKEQISQKKKIMENAQKKSPTTTTTPNSQSIDPKSVAVGGSLAFSQDLPQRQTLQVSLVEKNGSSPIANCNTIDSTKADGKASSSMTTSKPPTPSSIVQNTGIDASQPNVTVDISSTAPISLKAVEKTPGRGGTDSKLSKSTDISKSPDLSNTENKKSSSDKASASSVSKEVNERETSEKSNSTETINGYGNSIEGNPSKGLNKYSKIPIEKAPSSASKEFSPAEKFASNKAGLWDISSPKETEKLSRFNQKSIPITGAFPIQSDMGDTTSKQRLAIVSLEAKAVGDAADDKKETKAPSLSTEKNANSVQDATHIANGDG